MLGTFDNIDHVCFSVLRRSLQVLIASVFYGHIAEYIVEELDEETNVWGIAQIPLKSTGIYKIVSIESKSKEEVKMKECLNKSLAQIMYLPYMQNIINKALLDNNYLVETYLDKEWVAVAKGATINPSMIYRVSTQFLNEHKKCAALIGHIRQEFISAALSNDKVVVQYYDEVNNAWENKPKIESLVGRGIYRVIHKPVNMAETLEEYDESAKAAEESIKAAEESAKAAEESIKAAEESAKRYRQDHLKIGIKEQKTYIVEVTEKELYAILKGRYDTSN